MALATVSSQNIVRDEEEIPRYNSRNDLADDDFLEEGLLI